MAEKLRKWQILRRSEINRIHELHDTATRAQTDENSHPVFKVKFEFIEITKDEFSKIHNSIISLVTTDAEFDVEDGIRRDFENTYYAIKVIYHTLFDLRSESNIPPPQPKNNICLPKLQLLTFNGGITIFSSFLDMFDAVIHTNTQLSDIEKFNYLLSSLKGPPLNLVQKLPMTSANYNIAYDTLVKRYQNRRLIAAAHWSAIDNTPKLNSDNPQDLRNLLDTFADHLAALKLLKLPVDSWDFILVQMLLKRIDVSIATKFELHHSSSTIPKYIELTDFLTKHCCALDNVNLSHKVKSNIKRVDYPKPSYSHQRPSTTLLANTNTLACSICKKDHLIYKCPDFLGKSPSDRYRMVKDYNLCSNCLSNSHMLKACKSSYTCHKCGQNHHTMLHFEVTGSSTRLTTQNNTPDNSPHSGASSSSNNHSNGATRTQALTGISTRSNVLLPTAIVEVLDNRGNFQQLRTLLDSGSQSNFITHKCANRLGLSKYQLNFSVQGIGHTNTLISSEGISCLIKPIGQSAPTFNLETIVIPKICGDLPNIPISLSSDSPFKNLQLADSRFNIPGPIDLLIGADLFPHIVQPGRCTGDSEDPVALNSVFGFILMGKTSTESCVSPQTFICFDSTLENTLQKFWEVENVPSINCLSPDDLRCEQIFQDTSYRDESGRFVVSLPFRDGEPSFPGSRNIAMSRFLSLERRLLRNPTLFKDYSNFMKEYLDLGHMEHINHSNTDRSFYVPHHAVLKPSSTTSKLRVVFNASSKSPGQTSLNECLLTGPKLQRDLLTILLHFRLYRYVFTADIKQMYRQIRIHPSHTDYQRILWRFSPSEPIQDYRLLTVRYGFSCAPYLAIKTLLTLADQEKDNFPEAAKVIYTQTYVDDIVTGASTSEDAQYLQTQLITLLKKGGLELRKWAANDSRLLDTLPISHLCDETLALNFEADTPLKILGLRWNPSSDIFSFAVQSIDNTCTKRNLLSNLARTFDPLGILSPITFFVKFLIQRLWTLNLGWDTTPPDDIRRIWEQYTSELPSLTACKLPRFMLIEDSSTYEVHGFCDSSEKGYCAVIYLVQVSPTNVFSTHLVCAKSKVAPLKRISIPRLELCAAVLLARLLSFVMNVYDSVLPFKKICAWSDSSTVLWWLNSSPHRWKNFVSNRVSYIQDKIPRESWFYVKSNENPADVGSRGILPSSILTHSLWWAGSPFLVDSNRNWPHLPHGSAPEQALEEERNLTLAATVTPHLLDILLNNVSSLNRLKRIFAYVLRFINNCQKSSRNQSGCLLSTELHQSLTFFVKHIQAIVFNEDISLIKKGRSPSKSLRKLTPFLDDEGILRVGGRLAHAPISYERRFPALLPSNNRLTSLIIDHFHVTYFHASIQQVQYLVIQQFWILSSKRVIRRILSKCLKCWRTNPTTPQPPMGNLPSVRLSQLKPFLHVGVDYAGPFTITLSKTRGAKSSKAFLCLFVCLATKALHLELASDLSADAFLAALRRFIARRGRIQHIYSDNGTNFVSANKQLNNFLKDAAHKETIAWSFNPPSAPHFGGLWEAGVKSVKTHLARVIGAQVLSYEELNTVLIQIEALLNSRPLTPISNDPQDLTALSPGHFLNLEPLSAPLETNLTDTPINRLNRWQLLQRMHQDFWKRWSHEYLHTLHQRCKWNQNSTPIAPGVLVLIKNENFSPLTWPLARVTEVHPGKDGVIRVVTLKTAGGTFKRPVVKICPLPSEA